MVDALGGMAEGREWLEKNHNISHTLPEVPFSLEEKKNWLENLAQSWVPLPKFATSTHGLLAIMDEGTAPFWAKP